MNNASRKTMIISHSDTATLPATPPAFTLNTNPVDRIRISRIEMFFNPKVYNILIMK
jgi:hypothetical protein